jgi:hypothetical protein
MSREQDNKAIVGRWFGESAANLTCSGSRVCAETHSGCFGSSRVLTVILVPVAGVSATVQIDSGPRPPAE